MLVSERGSSVHPIFIRVAHFPNNSMGTLEGYNEYGFGKNTCPRKHSEDAAAPHYNMCCRGRPSVTSNLENANGGWVDEETLHMDFFRNTSLHGLKYIGQRKQHIIERLFWTAAFITGLVVAYYMIRDVWEKYKNNSVIITFAPFDTKIEEIPFPAITICNMNKVLKSKAKRFMEEAKRSPQVEPERVINARENLYYLNHVCSSSKSFTKSFNYSAARGKIDQWSLYVTNRNKEAYDGGKEDLWQFFLEASPSCSDMILKCTWQEEVHNCSELFTEMETDYGRCCTFNMAPQNVMHKLNRSSLSRNKKWWNWDGENLLKRTKITIDEDEDDHDDDSHSEKYNPLPAKNTTRPPVMSGSRTFHRQKVPGQSYGLSVLLNPDLEEYFCSTSDSQGFRIATHLPIDVPHISDMGSAIKPNSEVFINLRPEITIGVKDAIKSFSLDQRECYFNEEYELGYYNYYSSSNCVDECIANLTYQECNCRRHYQPGDDKSKPLCGPKQFSCASNIKKKFVENFKTQCRVCIPTCTEIVYHAMTTYTTMQSPEILWKDSNNRIAPWAYKNLSIVHIYFGERSTNAKLRKELYGTVDLIANFGGLMGLCLGFSGLSLIEVIYFLTLRAWCRARRRKHELSKQKKHGPTSSHHWHDGIARSDTTTQLLQNEISCIPVYKSPEVGCRRIHLQKNKKKLDKITISAAHFANNQRV